MSARLPESRAIALKAAQKEAETIFNKPVQKTEIFSSNSLVKEDSLSRKLISLSLGDSVPLRTKALEHWPERTDALCLHCSESCPSIPIPAVKYHDSKDDKYWVYGYFCRPCCSLAYMKEHPNTDTGRCILWTQAVIKKYFDIHEPIICAPPRSCLKKFGGKLSLEEFYGNSGLAFKTLHTPPFVTFAMYAELVKKPGEIIVEEDRNKVIGLRRPLQRTDPIAVQMETGKPPLILEYLASRGISTIKSPIAKEDEPKKKQQKLNTANKMESCNSGLGKYLI